MYCMVGHFANLAGLISELGFFWWCFFFFLVGFFWGVFLFFLKKNC